LAGGVAHDIQNFLTVVRAEAEMLREEQVSRDDRMRAVDGIHEAITGSAQLTRMLGGLSRKNVKERKTLVLQPFLRSSERLLRSMLPRSVTITVQVPEAPPLAVLASEIRLQQVLLNLAANARDAMPEGGRFKITLEAQGQDDSAWAVITVEDNGAGIPAEVQGKVFDELFTTKAAGHGTGFGLAIARNVVREHGGTIELRSEAGRGTCFTIRVPCTPRAPS
jgi:signal transduction histidine kinase